MDPPPRWIADQVGIRVTVDGDGFSGYFVCHQRLEEKTWNLFVPLLVASETMSGGYGFEEINPCQMTKREFQKRVGGFGRSWKTETKHDLEERLYD